MKSALILLGASLALTQADGFFGFAKASQTLVAQDSIPTAEPGEPFAARDSADQASPADLSDAALELGHCPGGHCHKPEPKKCHGGHCHKPEPTTATVTKVCKECVTVTKPVTIVVPDPTTIVKTRMCTTTLIRSRTVTRCVDHTKTDTKYCPVYKTSVQTVTVEPTCTPKPKCHQWQVQHVVEEGDYCENLANVYNTTIEDIQATNTWLNSTCDLTTGEVLCIPRDDDYSINKRDVAHHHHHHHEDDGGMTCDPKMGCGDPHHHHHHGHHHHGHHHHGHHHHHHGHHHHHHKDKGCKECGDHDPHHHHHHGHHHHHHGHHHHHHGHHHHHHHEKQSCGDHHECVACTSPETCTREGLNAACPENFMCQEIQTASPEN
ncbi:hypothetical protein SCUCBS95973_009222 [Sporothrix curviconia]|uniref:LysM domain-containing protein n=1 Tax=Sporothrix curviconia TaxID=1260050 RepID=A0ABP0CT50_9PEZI